MRLIVETKKRLSITDEGFVMKCKVNKCKKERYQNGDMCRIHQSEVRMFGHTRGQAERTAKTVSNKGSLSSGAYSKLGYVQSHETANLAAEQNDQARAAKRKFNFLHGIKKTKTCQFVGCENKIKPNWLYCFDHKSHYRDGKIEAGKALLAIDARKNKSITDER